jgi:hypothetical protein
MPVHRELDWLVERIELQRNTPVDGPDLQHRAAVPDRVDDPYQHDRLYSQRDDPVLDDLDRVGAGAFMYRVLDPAVHVWAVVRLEQRRDLYAGKPVDWPDELHRAARHGLPGDLADSPG